MAIISTADKYTITDKKTELFSDFGVDLQRHPGSKDVVRYTNEAAVKRSIINLLMTDFHERPFQPFIGANLRQLLFEPMGDELLGQIKQHILACIAKFEPRARVTNLTLTTSPDENAINVTLTFTLVNTTAPSSLSLILNRVR